MTNPLEESIQVSRHHWAIQILLDFLRALNLATVGGQRLLAILRGLVLLVSVSMLIYPLWLFLSNLGRGILLLSPALLFMMLGGLVGIAMILPHEGGGQ